MKTQSYENVFFPGAQVLAIANNLPRNREDLAFKKGDALLIEAVNETGAYKAKNIRTSETGWVPFEKLTAFDELRVNNNSAAVESAHITNSSINNATRPIVGGGRDHRQQHSEVHLTSMPWFHGKITREEAENMLLGPEPHTFSDGLFLIRESTHYPGDYTLCVLCAGKIEHYRIIFRNNKVTIDEDAFFSNLSQLVKFYSTKDNGLCCLLTHSVTKEGQQEFSVDPTDFASSGWEIPLKDLAREEVIGHGEFGDVYRGRYKNRVVAIKQMKEASKAAQKFLAEASVMTSLKHPNLVKLVGVVIGDPFYIVTEYMAKGDLVSYLRSRGRSVITKRDLLAFARDVCRGMSYLEEKRVVHRDLAARNVLISETCVAKVADFGLARAHDFSQTDTGKFPVKWSSPEVITQSKYTTKSDVWSFGILLWELYSFGKVPYPRIMLDDVLNHVERGYRNEIPEGCPTEVYQIMKDTWQKNPSDRPAFRTLLSRFDKLSSTPTTSTAAAAASSNS